MIVNSPFVTINTQLPTRALYTVNPTEAPNCPIKSQVEIPSLDPSFHCLWTCFISVASRISELVQPIISIINL